MIGIGEETWERGEIRTLYTIIFSVITIILHIIVLVQTYVEGEPNPQIWTILISLFILPCIFLLIFANMGCLHRKRKFKIIEKDNEYIVGVKFLFTYYVIAKRLKSIEEATNKIEEIKTHAKLEHEKTIIKKHGIIRK